MNRNFKLDFENWRARLDYYRFYSKELGKIQKTSSSDWSRVQSLCPFHSDSRPGSVVVNLQSGFFKCFACPASTGDAIWFLQKRYGLTFKEAINYLKENYL